MGPVRIERVVLRGPSIRSGFGQARRTLGLPARAPLPELARLPVHPLPGTLPTVGKPVLTQLNCVLPLGLPTRTAVFAALPERWRRFPVLVLILDIALDLAVVEIGAGITGFVVAPVGGVDDRPQHPIRLVHDRVGHTEQSERLSQR